MKLSEKIYYCRKKEGKSQEALAEDIGVSRQAVSKWETGELLPNIANLMALCELYNVSLDEMTKPINQQEYQGKTKKINKLMISLLAISAVWIMATIFFVYAQILSHVNLWTVFVWALPCSCIVGLVFNSLWGNRKMNYVIISVLIWSLITCFYLQFLQFNLVALYFLGVPVQISVILWSRIKTKRKGYIKHENN